jgi:hypothetical protein
LLRIVGRVHGDYFSICAGKLTADTSRSYVAKGVWCTVGQHRVPRATVVCIAMVPHGQTRSGKIKRVFVISKGPPPCHCFRPLTNHAICRV